MYDSENFAAPDDGSGPQADPADPGPQVDPGPQGEPGPRKPRKKRFAMIPAEFIADDRLTLRDFKVYAALKLHTFAKTDCYPKRATLAAITGIAENKVAVSTARLQQLGWIRKIGDGGRSRPARYQVFDELPAKKTSPDLGRVSDQEKTSPDLGRVYQETSPDLGMVSGLNQSRFGEGQGREEILKDGGGGGDTGVAPCGAPPAAAADPEFPEPPYQTIVDLYHAALPGNPEVKGLTKKRREAIKTIWLKFPDLNWWQRYFAHASNIPIITGDVQAKEGYAEPWIASLFDLMNEDRVEKIRSVEHPYIAVAKTPAPAPPKPAGQCMNCARSTPTGPEVRPTRFICALDKDHHAPTHGCKDFTG